MKISELALEARCSVETVRYYEKEGLMPLPGRTQANYRRYGPIHVERLRFIRNCRSLDMTHTEIRTLLGVMDAPTDNCGAVNQLLDQHIDHVGQRIAELLRLKAQLLRLRQQCPAEQAVGECGILQGLADMEAEAKPRRHSHVG